MDPLQEFILGYPKKKKRTAGSITRYTNIQDAAAATSDCCGIFEQDLAAAKKKFISLSKRNFCKK